ncbi:MAG: tyrosine recombinase [Clostridia bacterium]|nr:tyrosine recombinase [Clostridia bacterium]
MKTTIRKFAYYLEDDRNLKENTVESYKHDIECFATYLTLNEIKLYDVSDTDIKEYLDSLKIEHKKESTVSRTLASIKAYYTYLYDLGYIKKNPAKNLKYEKNARKTPAILTGREIEKLLNAPDMNSEKGLRDKTMLEILYATGIKVSELVNLKPEDIASSFEYIVLNSSSKPRIVPLYEEAADTLKVYLNSMRDKLNKKGSVYLFLNKNDGQLSRQGFWKIIKDYAGQAGIKKQITPTMLRHSFAAHLAKNGAELNMIKEMLGHSDISTTAVYSQFAKSRIAEVYKKSHPKASKRG